MATFFTDIVSGAENRGRVQVLQTPGASGSIVFAPLWGGFFNFKSIFTNVTIAEQGNYQFLHTLGNQIYVYVFGDRIGQFGLSGVSFYDNCGFVASTGAPTRVGISYVIAYYRALRLAAQPSPLLITLAPDMVFQTFLVGMRGQVLNAAQRMFQFHLQFALIPPRIRRAA